MNRRSAAALALLLGACATATPYQPLTKGAGYAEQRLESNRYRVRFVGNPATPRETVENYLMYRAAELTLQNGYDYFVIADQGTSAEPRVRAGGSSVGIGYGSGDFGSGVSIGVGTVLGGGGGDENYTAQADVLLFKGARPQGDLKSFDAREVLANLEPAIQRPKPR